MRIEETILSNLIYNEEYTRKVLPFLKKEYFSVREDSVIFEVINSFVSEYGKLPNKESIIIDLSNRKDLSETEYQNATEFVSKFANNGTDTEWLTNESEKFCKKRAVYNSIMDSIQIIEGKDKQYKEDAIPKLLQDALSVSFDVSVGHSYFEDAASRYDFYSSKEEGIKYDLHTLNKILKQMPNKALIVIAAQSGGGKSLMMSHIAGATLMQGKNVLYVSMEMSENKIAERIDANLLKTDISKLIDIGRDEFIGRIDKLRAKSQGMLFVKEYPPSSASASHIKSLIEELKVKQGFVPDLLVVDYLGITASSRMKLGGSVNTYTYLKSVAEELRGLGIEYDIPVLTGAQLNRGGFNSSDVDETSLAESMGLYMTADIMYAIIRTPELDELDQVMIKRLKDRYDDPNYFKRFVIGINRPRMFLYDLEDSAQDGLMEDEQDQRSRREHTRRETREDSRGSGIDSINF